MSDDEVARLEAESLDAVIAELDKQVEHLELETSDLRATRGRLVVRRVKLSNEKDSPYYLLGPWTAEQYIERSGRLFGHDDHTGSCDELIRVKWSGVGCSCGARWYCA